MSLLSLLSIAMFYLWVTLDDLDLNLSSFPAKDECLAKLEEQLVLARQAERKIPRMRCLHNYINCKWGLYGDTAYINPAIFKGTTRQRTVGSSAHFKEKQPRFRCMSLIRWQT